MRAKVDQDLLLNHRRTGLRNCLWWTSRLDIAPHDWHLPSNVSVGRRTVLDDVGQLVELTRVGGESRFFFDLSWRYLGNASCQDGIDKRKLPSFAFDRTE